MGIAMHYTAEKNGERKGEGEGRRGFKEM